MQTRQQMFLDVIGAPDTRFVIPVYQRVYSWSKRQCDELWMDVCRAGRAKTTHFVGTVLYAPETVSDTGVSRQLDIIDGQQRTATLTLIMIALAQYLRKRSLTLDAGIDASFLEERYLYAGAGAHRSGKLQLSRTDRATLQAVLDGSELPQEVSERVVDNFHLFCKKMESEDFDPQQLWDGMCQLLVIDAELGGADQPQLIFESLNSKGVPLTTADLVRNYLLIASTHDDQTRLYREYWEPIEGMFGDDPGSAKLNSAIRAWLSIRFPKVRIHDKSETYSVFKTYLEDEYDGTKEDLLDEMRSFCLMWAENYKFHGVMDGAKNYRTADWAKGKRATLTPPRDTFGGF